MRSRSSITLHFRAEAFDHPGGTVDAGTVMSWLDKAGYAAAATWAGRNVVGNYVGNMQFDHPVPVETPARVEARLIFTGSTSVHIQARLVLADTEDDDGKPLVATEVILVYVAVDDQYNPVRVPYWEPRTEAATKRRDLAAHRAQERRATDDKLSSVEFPPETETTAEVLSLRFIADSRNVYPGARIQAGQVLRWIDEAGSLCASRWAAQNALAVFAGGVQFYKGLTVGDLIEIEARVVKTTQRSMLVAVRCWSGPKLQRDVEMIAQGLTVMVVPSADGTTAEPVPQWQPATPAEVSLEKLCSELVALRNQEVYAWKVL